MDGVVNWVINLYKLLISEILWAIYNVYEMNVSGVIWFTEHLR